ncbi:MAG: ribosome maturation factor RimM [Alphaproteobacteria bacterium]
MSSPRKLILARCTRAHGVRGALLIESYTEPPEALFDYSDCLQMHTQGGEGESTSAPLQLERVLMHKSGAPAFLARLAGVDSRDSADTLAGREFFVWREDMPTLTRGVYWTDLVGLVARTELGEVLGEIVAVQDFGAGPLLEIVPVRENGDNKGDNKGQSFYLRYGAPELIRTDLDRGEVILRPRRWLEDSDDNETLKD